LKKEDGKLNQSTRTCAAVLQVIREVEEIGVWNLPDGFSNEVSQFVGVLHWGGKAEGALKKVTNFKM